MALDAKDTTIELAASAAKSEPMLFGVGITIASAIAIYSFWIQAQKVVPLKDTLDDLVEEQDKQTAVINSIQEDVNYICQKMKEEKERQESKELLRQVVAESRNAGEDFIRGIE